MSNIAEYFNRYDRKSPLREKFIRNHNLYSGEIFFEDCPEYTKVTADNYPKLHLAIAEECEFRGVETPEAYIDHSGVCRLASANPMAYAVFVEPDAYNIFDEKELRALAAHEIKHLYQGVWETFEECRQNEFDADRAAVESTDYKTIQSYVHKAAYLTINRIIPGPLQRVAHLFHEAFPNFLSENCWLKLDRQHPSPAARMKAMRDWETAREMKDAPLCEV